mgnify:CR=1 FL=1
MSVYVVEFFFFQAEDGIRDLVRSRGLGDVYKRQLLSRLLSRAYRENQYHGRAEIKESWLHSNESGTQGLIALSGARFGDIGLSILQNNLQQAEILTQKWANLFPDRFYIEIQRDGHANDCLLYTSPSPRDRTRSRMPSSA